MKKINYESIPHCCFSNVPVHRYYGMRRSITFILLCGVYLFVKYSPWKSIMINTDRVSKDEQQACITSLHFWYLPLEMWETCPLSEWRVGLWDLGSLLTFGWTVLGIAYHLIVHCLELQSFGGPINSLNCIYFT